MRHRRLQPSQEATDRGCRCRDEQSVRQVVSSRSQSGRGVTSRTSSSAHEEIGAEEWLSQISATSDASRQRDRGRQASLSSFVFPGLEVEPGDADVEVTPRVVGLPEARMARRVVLVPLSPGTPRSIQDRTAGSSGSGFAVLESEDEAITVAGVGGEDVPAGDDHADHPVAREDIESDSETDESDTERIHTAVQAAEVERAGPASVADVEAPEATMTRAISEGLVSLDTVDMGHLFSACAVVMKSQSTKLSPRCLSCSHAHRIEGNLCWCQVG